MSEQASTHASEREARDVAEAARESEWSGPSFVREMFLGRFRLDLIHPHPPDDPEEEERARPFLDALREFLERVDSDMIDRTGEIPEEYVQELRDMGAFGIKIPKEYGGLGLSYSSYVKAMALVTSKDGSLTALLSAHQSIGLPQPLKLFGNDAQKAKYFPRLAKGAISAFALTEVDAGSDPANMHTHAEPTPDGKYLHPRRREAVVHERDARRAVRRDGANPGCRRERQDAQADHRVHRRGVVAGRRGRAPLPLHGAQGDRERRHSIHQRARSTREHPLGRGPRAQARARHAEHRPPHASREHAPADARRCSRRRAPGRWSASSGACRSASTKRSRRSSA